MQPGTAAIVALALIAFAANSLLCRAALGAGSIGPAAFSLVRLAAGAAMLVALSSMRRRAAHSRVAGSWSQAASLFVYMAGFSYAYVELATGTGALILFGVVQLTMVARALQRGERPQRIEWLGLALALTGLVVLLLPGLRAPSPTGAVLMTIAGIGWGAYTLLGRGSRDPLAETAGNFARALGLMVVASPFVLPESDRASPVGIALAVISGALTSGVGYAIWYAALPAMTATRAALLQLAVPAIAAVAGIALLGEPATPRLFIAMLLVLGGIAIAIVGRR